MKLYLFPYENKGWALKEKDAKDILKLFKTKQEGLAYSVPLARQLEADLLIYSLKGEYKQRKNFKTKIWK